MSPCTPTTPPRATLPWRSRKHRGPGAFPSACPDPAGVPPEPAGRRRGGHRPSHRLGSLARRRSRGIFRGLFAPSVGLGRTETLELLDHAARILSWARGLPARLPTASDGTRTERGGFEPPNRLSPVNGLANRRFRPLSHLSTVGRLAVESEPPSATYQSAEAFVNHLDTNPRRRAPGTQTHADDAYLSHPFPIFFEILFASLQRIGVAALSKFRA